MSKKEQLIFCPINVKFYKYRPPHGPGFEIEILAPCATRTAKT